MSDDEFGIYNFNFKKNMTAAVERCSEHHKNATLPYYQCLCSGLTSDSFAYTRYKYYFCKRAADLEKEESAQHMKEAGETVGIILGVCVLLFLLIFIYRKFKVQISRCLNSMFSSIGMRQHYEACTRMFCVCCQKHPKSRLDELPPNQNLSGRPAGRCGNFCYSNTFLGFMEFICDCDCFRTRRAPKYMMPIFGKAKPRSPSEGTDDGGEDGSGDRLHEPIEMQPPRRMRSVRKAPPPPVAASAPSLPDTPGFDPEQRGTGTGKRRAPVPPAMRQPYSAPPPQYGELQFAQPAPAGSSHQFTAELNQAMAGRRWPSESDI
ncbi:uncharacterized protein LOC122364764 isoform X1 [Amphibalanus amphitrite]|uniref:uncharacterized protein LOC122364764 isoform X1 n=2 Tax=Amphibalanus amphitrite TaxID=1232801 RepID=UPI001C92ABDA|nr:uncharacterized protein LOC122364764 isoform X1 [Amphibalanus amphitrite]